MKFNIDKDDLTSSRILNCVRSDYSEDYRVNNENWDNTTSLFL